MKILSYRKLTDYKWLNLFRVSYQNRRGKEDEWMFASRQSEPFMEGTDAVGIIVYWEDKLVVIEQFRFPINDYIIECPAGLLDSGETVYTTVKKEVKEEVGLDVVATRVLTNAIYNSPGFSDENISYAVVNATGVPTTKYNEASEDIKIHVLNQEDAIRLLYSGKKISAKCWFILSAFANGIDWREV